MVSVSGLIRSSHSAQQKTDRAHLLVVGLAFPFSRDALDSLGPLGQSGTNEVTDETVEISMQSSRFPVEEAEHLVRHLPLHRIQSFFAGQTLPKDNLGADTLGERPTFHGGTIAWRGAKHQSGQMT